MGTSIVLNIRPNFEGLNDIHWRPLPLPIYEDFTYKKHFLTQYNNVYKAKKLKQTCFWDQ